MSITHDPTGSPETHDDTFNRIRGAVDEDVVKADLEGTGITPEDTSDLDHLPTQADVDTESETDSEAKTSADTEVNTDTEVGVENTDEILALETAESTPATRRNFIQKFAELSPLKKGISGLAAVVTVAGSGFLAGTFGDNTPKKVTPGTTISEGPSLGGELTPAETAAALSHTIEAYESQNGQLPLLVDDETIRTYPNPAPEYADANQNRVHLVPLTLPIEAEINEQTAADLFNDNVAYDLGRYMSLMANNGPSAIPIIQNEFLIFVGKGNEQSTNLQASLEQVVATYGSAIYTVLPTSPDSQEGTVFTNGVVIDNVNAESVPTIFSNNADIAINIQKFNENGEATNLSAVIEEVPLVYQRVARTGPAEFGDPGDLSVGAKEFAATIVDTSSK